MRRFRSGAKRAFTLYELILVCAMLVLVSGIAVSLVVFIRNYTKRSETDSDLISALTDIREQTDTWFSRMDILDVTDEYGNVTSYAVDTTVTTVDSKGTAVTYWATAQDGTYYIYSYEDNGSYMYVFYSKDKGAVWVESPVNLTLQINKYDSSYQYQQTENVRLRFSINMVVRGEKYICEVIYETSED